MRTSQQTWDVAITVNDSGAGHPMRKIAFPTPISRAIRERGFNRATIELTQDGFLVKPYVSDGKKPERMDDVVELPF